MPETDLLKTISTAWKWRGIDPVELVEHNPFGNVIVKTTTGHFWRICPEELSATQLAASDTDYRTLRLDSEFNRDWNMSALARQAEKTLGAPAEGRCYCFKIPAVLGGAYEVDNFGTIALWELLGVSGDMAQQIDELPDGAAVRLVLSKKPD